MSFKHIDYTYLNDSIARSDYKIMDLERKLSISPVTFYNYRYGYNDIPSKTLRDLVKILELDINKLLKLK